jgi:hypothetical protein
MTAKHKLVHQWVLRRQIPFTQKDAKREVGCSQQAVSAALYRHCYRKLYWAYRPDGHGNFTKVYFPLEWSLDQCREYLDGKTKAGKSRAYIGGKD